MPFTPFHFGLGAAVKAVAGKRFSFSVFCVAQVLTDLEPGYYLLRGESPVHRWTHTYLGAVAVAVLATLLTRPTYELGLGRRKKHGVPFSSWISERAPSLGVGLVSGIVGTVSHVFLDSLMHEDMRPFEPFSNANPVLGIVGFRTIQFGCLSLGVLGFIYAVAKSIMLARCPGRQGRQCGVKPDPGQNR